MNGKKSTAGNSVLSVFTGNTGIIGVLVILCVVVALATDKFLTPSNIISVLRQISINTYIALGMTLIIILGHIDLAVGAIVAMSGTLTVGFVVNQGLPIGVAIAAGIIIGVVAGLIDGMVVSKFRVPAFIITMAMMNVCNGIAYVYSGGQSTRITDKFFIAIGTGYLFNIIPLPVVYMVILIIVFSFLLSKTKFGTYVYAIGGPQIDGDSKYPNTFKVEESFGHTYNVFLLSYRYTKDGKSRVMQEELRLEINN